MNDINQYIIELRDTLRGSKLNFEIYSTLTGEKVRPKYINVLNRYPSYFATAIHAHFLACIIALYRLNDGRTDTYTITGLLRLLSHSGNFDQEKAEQYKLERNNLSVLEKKIKLLRHNVYGHQNLSRSIDYFFKKAEISPNDIQNLIQGYGVLLNNISKASGGSIHSFSESESVTLQILEKLNAIR